MMPNYFTRAFVAAAAILLSFSARADYPDRSIKIIVPIGAGSTTDYVARVIAETLRAAFKQPVVVENHAGAGGTLGTAVAARAPADGYTLLVASSAHTVNPVLYSQLPYNTLNDFSGISVLVTLPNILVVSPARNFRTTQELVNFGRKQPGVLTFGSGGVGSGAHMNAELFRAMATFDAVHVPFKSTPEVITSLIGGGVDFAFIPITTALPFLRNGKLVPLALGSAGRTPLLPDLPTTEEAGVPGSAHNEWIGLYTRSGVPAYIIRRLNLEIVKGLKTPALAEQFATVGASPSPTSPEETDAYVKAGILAISATVKLARIPTN